VKEKMRCVVAGSHWQGACQQSRGEGDLLSRGQLRGRRPLRHLGGVFIALLIRTLGLSLAEDVGAFAGHGEGAGGVDRACDGSGVGNVLTAAFDVRRKVRLRAVRPLLCC
jgi:hypothetical protein